LYFILIGQPEFETASLNNVRIFAKEEVYAALTLKMDGYEMSMYPSLAQL
jgi:hypothetical protein